MKSVYILLRQKLTKKSEEIQIPRLKNLMVQKNALKLYKSIITLTKESENVNAILVVLKKYCFQKTNKTRSVQNFLKESKYLVSHLKYFMQI